MWRLKDRASLPPASLCRHRKRDWSMCTLYLGAAGPYSSPMDVTECTENIRKQIGGLYLTSLAECCHLWFVSSHQLYKNSLGHLLTCLSDTRVHGKPDMIKLTYRMVKEFDAEAVCIISNQKLTRKVVYGMMSRGIPAFGAIWDS